MRSFDWLVARDNGYDARHVIAARVTPQGSPIPAARWQQLATAIADSLRAVPGVQTAGASNMAPLGDTTMIAGFRLAGDRPEPVIARGLGYVVTPGYLATLQLRLREGRLFTDSDVSGGLTPLIVNDDFVKGGTSTMAGRSSAAASTALSRRDAPRRSSALSAMC